MVLRQEGTVAEYRERFESLSALLTETSDEMLIGAFRKGLEEELRAELWVMRIRSLQDLMDTTHTLEEKNVILDKAHEDFFCQNT